MRKNNRKRTNGRLTQVIHLKNKDGEYTGKTKIIKHGVFPTIFQALANQSVTMSVNK